jgi:hypothetical protein
VRIRLIMVQTHIYTAVQYCSSSWEPTKLAAEKMGTVARNALRVIFKLHSKDVNGEVLFGDSGMLPLSLRILIVVHNTHPSIQTSLERTSHKAPTRTLDIHQEQICHSRISWGGRMLRH